MGSPMEITLGQQYNVREKPTVIYCILTFIDMQGHQKESKNKTETMWYIIKHGSNDILLRRL